MRKHAKITDPRFNAFQMKALANLTKMLAPWQVDADKLKEAGLIGDFLALESEMIDFLFKLDDAMPRPVAKKKRRKRAAKA